jgi:hydrogenase maturation protease
VNADGVLVVGYGNALRGDDAVGSTVAGLLAAGGHLPGARIEARHQLTPELAEDIAAARLVVLVDAAIGGRPGDVVVHPVVRCDGRLASHGADCAAIVDLASRLYGRTPPVVLISVSAEQFEPGAGLSPELESALPGVIRAIVDVVVAQDGRR